jgi:hypothetical protein
MHECAGRRTVAYTPTDVLQAALVHGVQSIVT